MPYRGVKCQGLSLHAIIKAMQSSKTQFKTPQYYLIPTLIIFAAFLIVLIIVYFMGKTSNSGSRYLVISDSATGKVYNRYPLTNGEFAIEFIHSVNQSPVRDTFKATGRLIQPTASRFYSYGAGMPTDLEEGQTLARDGDALVITGFTNTFKELNYIVGTVSDHLLFINGETVSLRDLCGKNAHVRIRVR